MKGKKGECLYPKKDPDACYEIDRMTELSDVQLGKWDLYFSKPKEKQIKEKIVECWIPYLKQLDDRLSKNVNPLYLVGNGITTAETTNGCHFLRFVLNEKHPYRKLYLAEVVKFPRVRNWCMTTIAEAFKPWFDQEPEGMLNYAL